MLIAIADAEGVPSRLFYIPSILVRGLAVALGLMPNCQRIYGSLEMDTG